MADQARGHRIEHLLEGEPAGRGDGDDRLFVIRRPTRRQCLQGRPFEIQPLAVASIAAPDELVDKAAISLEACQNRAIRAATARPRSLVSDGRAGFRSSRSHALSPDCCGSAACGNARTVPRSAASDPAVCRRRDCRTPPRGYRCDAPTGLGRAPTMRSADPPPVPQSSHHRARREHAPTLRRPDGSDRAGDPAAHRRC